MKVVLLAGGMGRRISEETDFLPKPMIEIGGMPILWHIMKEYSSYGFNDFIICAGYKQHIIKKWFSDYCFYTSDITFNLSQENKMIIHNYSAEPWRVTVVDTGAYTMTGGRLLRVKKYITDDCFMLTYGDGLCDVNILDLLSFHKTYGKIATLTTVYRKEDKGIVDIDPDNTVRAFREKKLRDKQKINAGYMVFERDIFDFISGDDSILESQILPILADRKQLMSFSHEGFWQCMDTLEQKRKLEMLIRDGNAPWIRW